MFGIPESWQPPIIAALLAIPVGIIIEKIRNRRPVLEYYLSSMSDFRIPSSTQGQPDLHVYTHSIVVHNRGRAPATDIEVVHRIPRNIVNQNIWYRVNPDVTFSENETPEGNLIIQVDRLLPQAGVTIHYLYTYPHRVDFIHSYVNCNETRGIPIAVLFTRQIPKWMQRLFLIFSILGIIYAVQLIITLIMKIIFKP